MIYDLTFARRIKICRLVVKSRKMLGDALGFDNCANPFLDMLLDLYLARYEQREVYLWPLCVASHCPQSTAHRKIVDMERQGLVVRSQGDQDKRRINIKMTGDGIELMDRLLDTMHRQGIDVR